MYVFICFVIESDWNALFPIFFRMMIFLYLIILNKLQTMVILESLQVIAFFSSKLRKNKSSLQQYFGLISNEDKLPKQVHFGPSPSF